MKFNQIFFIVIIFSSSILTSLADDAILADDLDPMRKSYLLCALNVVENFFDATETITFALPPTQLTEKAFSMVFVQAFLANLHHIGNWTIYIKRLSDIYKSVTINRKKIHNYILQIKNQQDVLNTITFLKQSQWNSQARFMILMFETYKEPAPIVLDIAKTLWKYHVINALILIPRHSDNSTLDVHTWFPYEFGNCGKNFTETVVINSCSYGKYSNANVNLYPQKIPLDLNGCPFTVRTVLWPPFIIPPHNFNRSDPQINFTEGIEIEMMNTIAKAANFKVVYTISHKIQDWGLLFDNGTASGGLFQQLLDENVDIGIAALASTVDRYKYLDSTNSYLTESVTWCVPIAKQEARWISLIKILQLYTWLATVGSFLVVGLIIWRISLITPEESMTFKNLSTCYLYSFSTTLCVTIKTLPRNMYVRIVFVMWVIYSYTLCSAYQTSLISKLTQPEYEHQMETVNEIFQSKMKFAYLNGLQIYFEDKSNYLAKKVIEEGTVCENAENCIQQIANDRNLALAVPRDYLQYISTGYYDKQRRLKIYWGKGNIVSYPIHMFCYKGFPLIGRINELSLRIKSGGFMKKWMQDTVFSYLKHRNRKKTDNTDEDDDDEEEEKDQMLKFKHMQGPFLLLICGLSLSMIAFIGELVHFKIRQLLKSYRSD